MLPVEMKAIITPLLEQARRSEPLTQILYSHVIRCALATRYWPGRLNSGNFGTQAKAGSAFCSFDFTLHAPG